MKINVLQMLHDNLYIYIVYLFEQVYTICIPCKIPLDMNYLKNYQQFFWLMGTCVN